jgi:hypothetical protein
MLGLTLAAITGLAAAGPLEKSLGANVRVVYLHGAWVWTALLFFAAAGLAGAVGLALQREGLHAWSGALGRTGLLFWITYLPLSMWAMQANWNGLFLAEPRWRLGLAFAAGGILLQIGVALLERPAWTSAGNLLFFAILALTLPRVQQIMHPSSPILQSGSQTIQLFFFSLVLLCLLAAIQVSALWVKRPNLPQPNA